MLWAKNEEGPSDEEALTTKRKKEKTGRDVPRNIERLALAFGHCPVRLKDQYARLMPIATAVKRQSSVTNRGAWKEALLRTSASKGSQNDKYEQTELREVVAAYQGWTAASSGVEQLFSKMKRSPVELSNGSAETDRRTAIVMGDGLSSMTETVAEARKIYASMLRSGAARPRTRTRFDSGKKGVKKEGSFANWNRVRKHALAEAVQKCETPPRKPSELQTESAVKERCFQRQNALKRKAEAMVNGLLLTDEITEEVQQEAARAAKVQKQADQQRAKQKKEYLLNAHLTSTKQSTQWALQNLIGPAWCCPKLGKQLQQEVKEKLHEHNVTSLTQDIIDAIDNNYHNFSMNFIRTTACRTYVKQSFWWSMALRMLKEKFVSCRRSTALPCCHLLRCWVKGARNLSSIQGKTCK